MGRRQTYNESVTIGADGTGTATFTAPNGVLHVEHVRVRVSTAIRQPTATIYINGADFEGSYAGANDQSDSAYDLESSETLECRWVGADVGARATVYVRGTQET